MWSNYQRMRAAQISVTVAKPTKDTKWGFSIVQDNDNQTVRIQAITDKGLLGHCPLQQQDILKTINNKKYGNDQTATDDLVNYDALIPVTIIAEAPKGNPKLVRAMARKPSPESTIGIGFYNIEHEGSSLLIINHLSPTGILAYSSLSQGDLVISINGIYCSEMPSEQAAELIRDTGSTVSILAMRSAALHEELNSSFTQRLAKRALWAAGQTVGALFAVGGTSAVAGNSLASPHVTELGASEGALPVDSGNRIFLTRTQSELTTSGLGSKTSRSQSVSHEEITMSMMTDTANMDDTISELSFTDADQELSAGFCEGITRDLANEMEDVMTNCEKTACQ